MSEKNVKCSLCKKSMDFHMHDCGKTVSMYYGCRTCEDYCEKCKEKLDKKEKLNDKS
jgi:hypothetical protein